MEGHDSLAFDGWADAHERTEEKHSEMTERMLIRHLQEMVRDGILVRHEEKVVPPCVRYSISEYGLTLAPVLEVICGWGRKHLERLKAGEASRS